MQRFSKGKGSCSCFSGVPRWMHALSCFSHSSPSREEDKLHCILYNNLYDDMLTLPNVFTKKISIKHIVTEWCLLDLLLTSLFSSHVAKGLPRP